MLPLPRLASACALIGATSWASAARVRRVHRARRTGNTETKMPDAVQIPGAPLRRTTSAGSTRIAPSTTSDRSNIGPST